MSCNIHGYSNCVSGVDIQQIISIMVHNGYPFKIFVSISKLKASAAAGQRACGGRTWGLGNKNTVAYPIRVHDMQERIPIKLHAAGIA
jgi:hypothetical protein